MIRRCEFGYEEMSLANCFHSEQRKNPPSLVSAIRYSILKGQGFIASHIGPNQDEKYDGEEE
jgi:hypothetical protein